MNVVLLEDGKTWMEDKDTKYFTVEYDEDKPLKFTEDHKESSYISCVEITSLEAALQSVLQNNDLEKLLETQDILEDYLIKIDDQMDVDALDMEDEMLSHDDVNMAEDLESETSKTYLVNFSMSGAGTLSIQANSKEEAEEASYYTSTPELMREADFKGGFEVGDVYEDE